MNTRHIYQRKVFYYETDQMGIVHHSNYIRWFEEARIDYMAQMGIGYDVMEDEGIVSPVLSVEASYLRMLHFGDSVTIETWIKEYNGIKLTIGYEVISDKSGKVHCKGTSKHCFLDGTGRPLSLKQSSPKFHEMFMREYQRQKAQKEK